MTFQKTVDHVPTINQAIKVPIKRIVREGWSHTVLHENTYTKQKEPHRLELSAEDRRGAKVIFSVDGVDQCWWPIYEQMIPCDHKLRNGGYVPNDNCWQWCVVGRDGKRCRALYLWGNAHIGTRTDLNLRYPIHVMVKSGRAAYSQQFDRRRARKRRAMKRRIARYKRRMGMD
jgi:hypothetical protein